MECIPNPRTTDFTGTWCCDEIRGDYDAFLRAAGVGWMGRNAARMAAYGIGIRQIIAMEDDYHAMTITVQPVVSFFPTTTQRLLINGEEQDLTLADGTAGRGMCEWLADGALSYTATAHHGKHAGRSLTFTRRLEGDRMWLCLQTGAPPVEVLRAFCREADRPERTLTSAARTRRANRPRA